MLIVRQPEIIKKVLREVELGVISRSWLHKGTLHRLGMAIEEEI